MIDLRWYFIFAVVLGLAGPPTASGKATWYGPGYFNRPMRNGGIYTGNKMTCAVDTQMWDALGGKTLAVCSVSKCVQVEVTDTGNLLEAGVLLDLSPRAFKALRDYGSPWDNDGQMQVQVWEVGR